MRAKWRKIIWAILAVQLLLLHLSAMELVPYRIIYKLNILIERAVIHFNLPHFIYDKWQQLLLLGWLATVFIILFFHYWNYIRFRRKCVDQVCMVPDGPVRQSLRDAVLETGLGENGFPRKERAFLYYARGIREPFVMGFRRPVLLLPEREYSENALKFIFLHECYHIRHRDMLYKFFWLLMQSLLWFQPLIYLLAALGSRDVEVACDEAVVEGKDMGARKEYGYALLECLQREREKGQAYSAYFYHGKRLMKARFKAIMKENHRWDALAYAGIAVLLLDLAFHLYRLGGLQYERYQENIEKPVTPIYEGYELPEHFTESAIAQMTKLEPVPENARHEERRAANLYEEKEYEDLPYAAEGPWQVRLKDADFYDFAVELLLQRYLSYYIDWNWATERNPETHSEFIRFHTLYGRLLAGNMQECVYALTIQYCVGTLEDMAQFPEELAEKARFTCEKGLIYYAYFDWTVHMRMAKDYVFELEGIAQTDQVLAAFERKYGQADFSDMPVLDLADEVPEPDKGLLLPKEEISAAPKPYQMEIRENTLWVSGRDGVFREVPVSMDVLLARGDQKDGPLFSLPPESYQLDERKQIFAYGGNPTLQVVYYDEEQECFQSSSVTGGDPGGRKIFVNFPENNQDGFLFYTEGRVMNEEGSSLYRTWDGGASWKFMGPAGPSIHSMTTDAVFINNQVGFVTIKSSREPNIWRTSDGGEHWTELMLPDVPEGYSMAYAPECRGEVLALYLGKEESSEYDGKKAKYESADQGKTWIYKGYVLRK